MIELTRDEIYLLDWLAKQDGAPLAGCRGPALERLVEKGLASDATCYVIVTDQGWKIATGET